MNDNPTANREAGDDALLRRLSEAIDRGLSPVPGYLTSIADEAFGWRGPDVLLAELLFDSASSELAGVRGTATGRRSFRYGAYDSVIRVHLTNDSIVVMVEPPVSADCRIATAGGTISYRTDELGELVADAPLLPIRVEVDLPGGTAHTPWIIG